MTRHTLIVSLILGSLCTFAVTSEKSPALARAENDYKPLEPAEDEVAPSAAPIRIASAPARGNIISGRVVDSAGRPQPNVSIVATATGRTGSAARVTATTDSHGNFVIRGVQPGQRYLVLATAPYSKVPLIGRVATVAPDDRVSIEIARPFARQPDRAPATTPRLATRSAPRSNSSSPARPHADPWNMPAPSTRRTPESNSAPPASAAVSRPVYRATKLGPSLLDPLPTDTPIGDSDRAAAPSAEITGIQELETPSEHPSPRLNVLEPRSARPALTGPARPMCEFDGSRLVDFQLPDIDNQAVTFQNLEAQLILVDFWGTWCPYCLKSMPQLISLQRRYGPQGLQVIGIAYEQGAQAERERRVRDVREQLGVNYPILMGNGQGACPVRDKFRVQIYPTLVLLDKSGRVVWRKEGPGPNEMDQLEKLLKAQLSGTRSRYN